MPAQPNAPAYHELTPAEQFVLGVCRCWDAFAAGPDANAAWRELAPVFSYMGVLAAMCAFERIFYLLCRVFPHPVLQFNDPDSTNVGDDEARILTSLAHLQRGQARAAVSLLRVSLSCERTLALLPPLARIAAILDARGHRLPLHPGATAYSDAFVTPPPPPAARGETSSRPQIQAR